MQAASYIEARSFYFGSEVVDIWLLLAVLVFFFLDLAFV